MDLRGLYSHSQDMLSSVTDKHVRLLSLSCSSLLWDLSPPRCPCSPGADKHGRSDLSHAAPAGRSAPSTVRLRPALCRLLPDGFLCQTPASSASQCLLQWNDRPSTPILQPGETEEGLLFSSSVPYMRVRQVPENTFRSLTHDHKQPRLLKKNSLQ